MPRRPCLRGLDFGARGMVLHRLRIVLGIRHHRAVRTDHGDARIRAPPRLTRPIFRGRGFHPRHLPGQDVRSGGEQLLNRMGFALSGKARQVEIQDEDGDGDQGEGADQQLAEQRTAKRHVRFPGADRPSCGNRRRAPFQYTPGSRVGPPPSRAGGECGRPRCGG